MRQRTEISDDIKERIVHAYNNGSTISNIAMVFNINRTTIQGIVKKYLVFGTPARKIRMNNTPKKLSVEQIFTIKGWLEEDCSLSLRAIAEKCRAMFNITVSKSTVDNVIQGFYFSLKRIHKVPQRRNDIETIESRYNYAISFINIQSRFSQNELIYIDETGYNISMRTARGRSLVGTPAVLTVPALRCRNISVCAAMNRDGPLKYEYKLTPYNSEQYGIFVDSLITALKAQSEHKYIFIMDNVGFHKTENIKRIIREANF